MLKSIKAEMYKLYKNRTFKVISVIAIALAMVMILLSSSVMEKIMMDSLGEMPEEEKQQVMEQMMNLSNSEDVVTPGQLGIHLIAEDPMNPTAIEVYHASFGSGIMEILIGVLVAALMAKEYSQGTIKNFLAYGKRREEFYIAKFLAMAVGVTILLALLTLVSTVGVIIMRGWGSEFEFSQLVGMIKTFVAAVMANSAILALIMVIAALVKSNGATIGIAVAVFIGVPTLGGVLYGIYPWFDKIYEVLPFYNSALAVSINASGTDLLRSIVISLVTIVISLFIGIKTFKLQDIK